VPRRSSQNNRNPAGGDNGAPTRWEYSGWNHNLTWADVRVGDTFASNTEHEVVNPGNPFVYIITAVNYDTVRLGPRGSERVDVVVDVAMNESGRVRETQWSGSPDDFYYNDVLVARAP